MSRYIDADALMEDFACFVRRANNSDFAKEPTWNDAISIVEKASTANVRENIHAHWVYKALEGFTNITFPVCSNCDEDAINYVESNFCPNCGAVMDEENEDAEIH